MVRANRGIDGDRLPDHINSQFRPPCLDGGNSEQVQAVSMAGVNIQSLAVKAFGLGEPAGLMVLPSLGKDLLSGPGCFLAARQST